MLEAVMVGGTPDHERRSCFDCLHCKAAVTWWCKNDKAVEWRGTQIPGGIGCPYWEPCKTLDDLGFFARHFGGYIRISAT